MPQVNEIPISNIHRANPRQSSSTWDQLCRDGTVSNRSFYSQRKHKRENTMRALTIGVITRRLFLSAASTRSNRILRRSCGVGVQVVHRMGTTIPHIVYRASLGITGGSYCGAWMADRRDQMVTDGTTFLSTDCGN